MRNSNVSDSIDRELDNFRPDSHWDDDEIIEYYKKKTREICSRLEEEEKIKRNNFLLNNNKNLLLKNLVKSQRLKRVGSSFRTKVSNNNSKRSANASPIKRIVSAKPKKIIKEEEPESVLNMLFPYVNENDFKIEPFKSGADLRNENRRKRENIPVVKVNQERRLKSNFLKKYKKYDKDLNTYADNPSIRRSSAYLTQEQIKRREFIKSKKFWISSVDFKRYFGKKSENDRIKEKNKNEQYISDKYIEPSQSNILRIIDKNKWISKKKFSCLKKKYFFTNINTLIKLYFL